jgi:hypothetical protein
MLRDLRSCVVCGAPCHCSLPSLHLPLQLRSRLLPLLPHLRRHRPCCKSAAGRSCCHPTAEAAVSICSADERRSRLLVYVYPSAKEDSRSAKPALFFFLALGFALYWLLWPLALASRFALALLWQAPECPPPMPHSWPSDPRCLCAFVPYPLQLPGSVQLPVQ